MFHQAYQAHQAIRTMLMNREELGYPVILDSGWNTAKPLHDFLQQAGNITDAQWGSLPVPLSLSA